MGKQKEDPKSRNDKIWDVLGPVIIFGGVMGLIVVGAWISVSLTTHHVSIHFNHYDALTNASLVEEKQVNATMIQACFCDHPWSKLETPTDTIDYTALKRNTYSFVPYPIYFSLKGIDHYIVATNALQDTNKYTMDTKYFDTDGDGTKEWFVTIWLTGEMLDQMNNELTINVPWYNEQIVSSGGGGASFSIGD